MVTNAPSSDRPSTRPATWQIATGALVGFVVAFVAGVAAYRVAPDVFGGATGWEDLTSIAASLFSFAPVGALAGAAVVARHELGAWLQSRAGEYRYLVWIGLALAPVIGVAAAATADNPTTPIAAGVIGMPIGAGLGLAMATMLSRGRRSGRPAGSAS